MKTEEPATRRSDRASLVQRLVHFYKFLNRRDWSKCHDYIDPRLRGGVSPDDYAVAMERFYSAHGPIRQIRVVAMSFHPGAVAKADGRDFAYVTVSWKDRNNDLHHFRERWIKDQDGWFTRVVGLVPRPSS